jgi:hypothetical protein
MTTLHLNAPAGRAAAKPASAPGALTAARLKVTVVLNAAELLTSQRPTGNPAAPCTSICRGAR